jgi:hypothetical protein
MLQTLVYAECLRTHVGELGRDINRVARACGSSHPIS